MSSQDRSAAQDRAWGRDDWSEATVEEMRTRLDEIGPPWGNSKIPKALAESFWIAYEALERLETSGYEFSFQVFEVTAEEAETLFDATASFVHERADQVFGIGPGPIKDERDQPVSDAAQDRGPVPRG